MKKMFIALGVATLLVSCAKEVYVPPKQEIKKPEMTVEELNQFVLENMVATLWADPSIKTYEVDSVLLDGVKVVTAGLMKSDACRYLQLLQYTDQTKSLMRQINIGDNDNYRCGTYIYNDNVTALDFTLIVGTEVKVWISCPVKISFNNNYDSNTKWPVNDPHTMMVYGKKLLQKN